MSDFWIGFVWGFVGSWVVTSLGSGVIIGKLLFRLRTAMQVIGALRSVRPSRLQ